MLLGRRLYPAHFPPPGPARLSGRLNPVENAEGVDIRRVPLIRQLEPGAAQWQMTSGQSRNTGAPVSGSSRGPGPLMGLVSRDAQLTTGRPPGAGPMNLGSVRLQSGQPGAGSMNLTERPWSSRPLKRGVEPEPSRVT